MRDKKRNNTINKIAVAACVAAAGCQCALAVGVIAHGRPSGLSAGIMIQSMIALFAVELVCIFSIVQTKKKQLEEWERDIRKKELERIILTESNKQAQYIALQNQINPHFLYNTLESIRSDAAYAEMDEIANVAGALSLFFRYTISDIDKIASFKDELENVENYFRIQKYRFADRLELITEIEENIDLNRLQMPRLTLQPIIENAIIHGIESCGGKKHVRVEVELLDYGYYVYIIDDGIGIDREKLNEINERLEHPEQEDVVKTERKGGIGMCNVAQRIKLLFGQEYGIRVYSRPGRGTRVAIWLPRREKEGRE